MYLGDRMHRDFENEISRSESKCLELRFLNNKISEPVYTGIAIKGEGGECLKVVLVDRCTGNLVKTGPEASAQVEIRAIDESFHKSNEEDWTPNEFKAKILEGRRGKLTGDICIQLQEGIGSVDEIYFSHNRVHFPKTKLKLGAQIVNLSGGIRIREAKTESFTIKDRREMNKEHRPLSPSDEVWRLKNIAKNGPFHVKLREENIHKIQDFLTELDRNPQSLQNVLGKMAPVMFEATVKHARTCSPDIKDNYVGPAVQQDAGVMLKSMGEGSCFGLEDKHDSRHCPCANKDDGRMLMASEYERERVASSSDGVSHKFSAAASTSRQESISGNHIEASGNVELDLAKLNAPSEDTLSSPHHTEKADAQNLAEVNVDGTSKMPTIGNSSNPTVGVNLTVAKVLTDDAYHKGNDQPWSEANPDTMDQVRLELEDQPIYSPAYYYYGGYHGSSDVPLPPHTNLEHDKRREKMARSHDKRRLKMVFTAVRWIRRTVRMKKQIHISKYGYFVGDMKMLGKQEERLFL